MNKILMNKILMNKILVNKILVNKILVNKILVNKILMENGSPQEGENLVPGFAVHLTRVTHSATWRLGGSISQPPRDAPGPSA